MLDYREINEAINEIESKKLSYETCRNLAALYVIKDRLERCSCADGSTVNSEFIDVIHGKPMALVVPVLDDLMQTVRMLSPKTYETTINNLKSIKAG